MISVWVDRESVAMGDDVESHEVKWEFDDHACPGDVLDRVIESGYLASVAGEVSWVMSVGRFEVQAQDGYTSVRGVATHAAAVLNVPYRGEPKVIVLSTYSLTQPFVSSPQLAVADRTWAVEFLYSSGGAVQSVGGFRKWLYEDEARRRAITTS